jgi:hypothetical protein
VYAVVLDLAAMYERYRTAISADEAERLLGLVRPLLPPAPPSAHHHHPQAPAVGGVAAAGTGAAAAGGGA